MYVKVALSKPLKIPRMWHPWRSSYRSHHAPPQMGDINGAAVATYDHNNPISHVCIGFRAGARYEKRSELGLTHCLRNCAGLATKSFTQFGITNHLAAIGASFNATTTRDCIFYHLQCHRDFLYRGLPYFAQAVTKQAFKPWEVSDNVPRMKLELARLHQDQPERLVMECLHKVAFRGGLANSLYSPEHMLNEHEPEMLKSFVGQHFSANKMAITAIGVGHSDFLTWGSKVIGVDGSGKPEESPSTYGGGEAHCVSGRSKAYVAVATEGSGLKDIKSAVALAVAGHALGPGPRIEWKTGCSGGASPFCQAVSKCTSGPYTVSGINCSYHDTGLFGFYVAADGKDMGNVLKAVMGLFKATLSSGIKEVDLKRGKQLLKTALGLEIESCYGLAENLTMQQLVLGKTMDFKELSKLVDSVTVADVATALKKGAGKNLSMAALGNLTTTPRLDQIK